MTRYIDADKVIEPFEKAIAEHGEDYLRDWSTGYEGLKVILEQTPTEDVEDIVHSKWIRINVNGMYKIKCENCDYTEPEYIACIRNYCPCCGAKMEKE